MQVGNAQKFDRVQYNCQRRSSPFLSKSDFFLHTKTLGIFTHFLFDWKLVWAGLIQRFQETVPLKIWDFGFRFSKLSVLKVFLANEIPLPSLSRRFLLILEPRVVICRTYLVMHAQSILYIK
ncbi:uncharacterized protein [Pyrus communis]|uniref:uncharacterized protein isoform X3 n=1 Tax=Pyrus communis TaxID=23211 RepID=UPI0035C18A92